MRFFNYEKKILRSLAKPVRFKYCGELEKEVLVTYWIEKKTLTLLWGFIKFENCTIENNFNEIRNKELNYRLLSLKDYMILEDMVKMTELKYKLDNIDLFFTV